MKMRILLFFTIFVFSFILSAGGKEELKEIRKLYNNGNYKEAALLSYHTLKTMVKTPDDPLAGDVYHSGYDSYARLGKYEEQAILQDFVMNF